MASPLVPLLPLPEHLEPFLELPPAEANALFSPLLLPAVSNPSLLTFLLDVVPPASRDLEHRDAHGNTPLLLATALQQHLAVQQLVQAGADLNATDAAGWTPLHWAARGKDSSITTYLLNQRPHLHIRSHAGLLPAQLVRKGERGRAMSQLLLLAELTLQEEEDRAQGTDETEEVARARAQKQETVERALQRAQSRRERAKANATKRQVASRVLDVPLSRFGERPPSLFPSYPPSSHSDSVSESDDDSLSSQSVAEVFPWCDPSATSALLFTRTSLPSLPSLLAFLIPSSPVPFTRDRVSRLTPATGLFYYCRGIGLSNKSGAGGEKERQEEQMLVEELLEGAVERFEEVAQSNPMDLPGLTHLLSNALTLLYYLRRSFVAGGGVGGVSTVPHWTSLASLIQELVILLLRDVEKRIDGMLETALLGYVEAGHGNKVEFVQEGWGAGRLAEGLRRLGRASGAAVGVGESLGKTTPTKNGLLSPLGTPASPTRATLPLPTTPTRISKPFPFSPAAKPDLSPRTIVELLDSTLFVLQQYDIPLLVVVQSFSQLFWWIGAETFNRILSSIYISRSTATQIESNLLAISSWLSTTALPHSLLSHLTPLNQLLTFVQSLSTCATLDDLISSIQRVPSLSPAILGKVAASYRYELGESRLGIELGGYLERTMKQFLASGGSSSGTTRDINAGEQERRTLEGLALGGNFGEWTPPKGERLGGELMDSRYTLPFHLPRLPSLLLGTAAGGEEAPVLPDWFWAGLDRALGGPRGKGVEGRRGALGGEEWEE